MPTVKRPSSVSGRLARLGFTDPDAAAALLREPALAGLIDPLEDVFDDGLLVAMSTVADPDLALHGLVAMLGALGPERDGPRRGGRPPRGGPATDGGSHPARLHALLRSGGPGRDRLLSVLGSSVALGEHLRRHPGHWTVLLEEQQPGPRGDGDLTWLRRARARFVRDELLRGVRADPEDAHPVSELPRAEAYDALRVAYRRRLLAVAGRDVTSADPVAAMPGVAAELADLAAAALEAALAIARSELPDAGAGCRFAVIGMGKGGGGELNYVSDVDVIYVAEAAPPAEGQERDEAAGRAAEAAALAAGSRLAAGLARACSAATKEGTLWPVDAGLRPEGRHGPLVRTLASHVSYYERWAATWEFQALLKARAVAGDEELGRRYVEAMSPFVWQAAQRANFVADVQAMRRRVEQHVQPKDADRQLKLGAGGLRDVEFSVQLLQLVHGRTDERLRSGNTLVALEALSTYGYVGRDDAAELDRAYRMLRTLEHRIQLFQLRRSHMVPRDEADLRRIGRSFGFSAHPATELAERWQQQARVVRRLHEKLFYRPLLTAAAALSSDDARLTPEAAKARLAALGYRDPDGAMRHLRALTSGVSRRAAIQRTLLPVMLGWFAAGADPDAGLLAFRRLSDSLGTTHWYLRMLRDSGAAAERMAHVVSSGRLAADLLERAPETVAMFDDDAQLTPRDRETIRRSVRFAAARHEDPAAIALAARSVRRREVVRTAIADVVGLIDLPQVGRALSDATIAALDGGLIAATKVAMARYGDPLPTRLLVVAMGRVGGGEAGYGSDADVMFVHEPVPGAQERVAQDAAVLVVSELLLLLSRPGLEPAVEVDPDLRPEGRNGPLVRSLASYAEYYSRWSSPWEAQALTRAVPVVGDDDLARRFVELIDPVRWPAGGLPEAAVREIRRIKGRVEGERLPRGADPNRHLKLGRGGLADVEWTVQLLQLQHAGELPELRTTSTPQALAAAVAAGVLDEADGVVLTHAWELASRLRNATVLWRGRPSDSLPTTTQDLDGVARLTGYPPASVGRLEEDHQRAARRARAVVERVFYG